MKESTPDQDSNSSSIILEDSKGCFCAKKQCMIGIASIAIGIGGFVVSLLI